MSALSFDPSLSVHADPPEEPVGAEAEVEPEFDGPEKESIAEVGTDVSPLVFPVEGRSLDSVDEMLPSEPVSVVGDDLLPEPLPDDEGEPVLLSAGAEELSVPDG